MAGNFRQVVRSRSASIQGIVGAADVMRRSRKLEQTPSLVDADVADDVGRTHACR